MADTKKEHYVPRCYLRNFADEQECIDVFDKWNLQVRKNQRILNIAMENRFYDIDLLRILSDLDNDARQKAKADILKMVGLESWEEIEPIISNKKYIEKEHFAKLEGLYASLLDQIIANSHNGNAWVLHNCSALSEEEKALFSVFVSMQVIRSKNFRDSLNDGIEKLAQALVYKEQMNNPDALPKDAFQIEANSEFIKLQHSSMIMDPKITLHFAEILCNHVWIIHYNKTKVPFLTSDYPIVNIPHKFDRHLSYAGFASEGIEIAFPISPRMLLCMYDQNTYKAHFSDRAFITIDDKKLIEYYNRWQIINSRRCVFGIGTDFSAEIDFCKKNPQLQSYISRIDIE